MTPDETLAGLLGKVEEIKGYGETARRAGRDPVNQPMINNWVEAMGDANPRWLAGEAPPAMAQVWTMGGLHPQRDPKDPLHSMMGALTEAGYTGVLGTNCDQTYRRTVKVGEEVTITTRLESVVGPKQTAMGEGWFVTTISTWRVGDEEVATMLFRVLKYRPKAAEPAPEPALDGSIVDVAKVLRPTVNRDTEFFWAGTRAGELRIQSCNACGDLRHPPGPSCPSCGAFDRGHVVASGEGTLFSYVVHRHPPVPGRTPPILIGLVDLAEGPRMVGEIVGVEPDDLSVGMALRADFHRIDDDLTLPVWRRA